MSWLYPPPRRTRHTLGKLGSKLRLNPSQKGNASRHKAWNFFAEIHIGPKVALGHFFLSNRAPLAV
jgi:hypothetical protein